MAILTTVLTIAAAVSTIGGFKRSIESYARDLAVGTARGIIEDINRLDPELKFSRETAEILANWTNPESVYQIDIFKTAVSDGESYVEVWATSQNRPEEVFKNDDDIRKMMELAAERADLIKLNSGQTVWRVYIPIRDNRPGRKTKPCCGPIAALTAGTVSGTAPTPLH
jgi:hypothetical protein